MKRLILILIMPLLLAACGSSKPQPIEGSKTTPTGAAEQYFHALGNRDAQWACSIAASPMRAHWIAMAHASSCEEAVSRLTQDLGENQLQPLRHVKVKLLQTEHRGGEVIAEVQREGGTERLGMIRSGSYWYVTETIKSSG